MDPTALHRDITRMQEQVNQAAEHMRSKVEGVRQHLGSMRWIREQYLHVSKQIQQWEDAIRHGRERTKRKNERIGRFLESTPTCPGESCGGRLQKTENTENDKVKAVIGPQYDVECEACKRIIYLPPVLYFTWNADDYLSAARVLRKDKTNGNVAGVSTFLMHQAAELYLKSLGTCTLYADQDEDEDSEDIQGESLGYTRHNLPGLFQKLYPSIRNELKEYEKEEPKRESVESLVNAIPSQTAEMFRYGFLLRGEYGQITINGPDVWVKGKNISKMLLDLCARLEDFTSEQARL